MAAPLDMAQPRGRAHSRDWAMSTNAIVTEAKTHKGLSMKLRDETTQTRKQTERQTREQQIHVDDMLRKKVQETTLLKSKIEKRLAGLQLEIDKLTNARNRGDKLYNDLKRPLKKSETRLHLRERRPERERIDDRVHRALQGEQDELARASALLGELIQEADTRLSRMAQCKSALKADHQDKSQSLRLDVECLDLPARAAAEKQRDAVQFQGSPASSPRVPAAGEGANAVGKSTTLPVIWRQSTERTLADSQKLENESCELRRRITGVLKQVTDVRENHAALVREALAQKVKTTQSLHCRLNSQLLEINSELDELEEQRQTTERALQAKSVPLGIVENRLQIRRTRPAREAVRDMVEEALEQEHAQLVHSIRKLEAKLQHIMQEQERLRTQARHIESDLRDKNTSMNIDKRCQDLTTNSGQSTPSLPVSVRSEALRTQQQMARHERADEFRKGGSRLVPKPPRGQPDGGPRRAKDAQAVHRPNGIYA
eukprot:TRINITY_DN1989_c0_g1_i2.p1 TRINITY_DN1989_c0_g1~~TRINITY_DN1989_c0_g1_i2.p1  ORF type:complete len:512 (+),score=180.64 TRINITY_DN1989_c0_g1_i2:76-1536(+)